MEPQIVICDEGDIIIKKNKHLYYVLCCYVSIMSLFCIYYAFSKINDNIILSLLCVAIKKVRPYYVIIMCLPKFYYVFIMCIFSIANNLLCVYFCSPENYYILIMCHCFLTNFVIMCLLFDS